MTCCVSTGCRRFRPERFHEKFAVAAHDTHPSIAVAELMRLLVDELALGWELAWSINAPDLRLYQSHVLPEALERWPPGPVRSHAAGHLEIIYEINARFLDEVRIAFFGDDERLARMSLIDESAATCALAHLATAGSHAVNGVASCTPSC